MEAERQYKLLLLRDISSFFVPPSDCLAFGRMHNKKTAGISSKSFFCPSALLPEISIENDSVVHVQ